MFDTVSGLPVHILVVHAAVVLVPLMALVTVAFTVRPLWRPGLGWAVLGNVVALGAALVAKESGEAFLARLQVSGELVSDHVYHGDRLPVVVAVQLLASVLALVLVRKERRGLTVISVVVVLLAGIAAGYYTYETGHSGSTAVWRDTVAATNP